MFRLYHDKVQNPDRVVTDENGLIRMDDWEMREDVQKEVMDNCIGLSRAVFSCYSIGNKISIFCFFLYILCLKY